MRPLRAMMVSNRGSVLALLAWQWRAVTAFVAAGVAVLIVHRWVWPGAKIPSLPLGIVGGALGIFVSFRTNSAYARWWEGRQLWGRLVNASRTLCSQALAYLPAEGEGRALAATVVRRHIAYVHALRAVLRTQDLMADPDVRPFLAPAEYARLATESNANHALVHENYAALALAARKGWVDGHQLRAFDETLRTILDVQGGCERIKKTPMPRGYAFIAERLILAFSMLLPLATVEDLGAWVVPVNVLVCLAFSLISEAGRVLEDPFTLFWNGLPLTALSRTIEVNLRQRLGETDLPPIPGPNEKGVLM
ncbi:MAG TPA: bestrophin family ion channel [Polyangiaceae bacterium]|nr:bestrophin family ion channel [Polyangiaceae bacterium]